MEKSRVFQGLSIYSQELLLPKDFTALFEYMMPVIRKCKTIALKVSDVVNVLDLDTQKEICRAGHVKIWEASGRGDISMFEPFFQMLNTSTAEYDNCLAVISGDVTLTDVTEITIKLQEKASNNGNMCVGLDLDTEAGDDKMIHVILSGMLDRQKKGIDMEKFNVASLQEELRKGFEQVIRETEADDE